MYVCMCKAKSIIDGFFFGFFHAPFPHLILVGKLGKFTQIRKFDGENLENWERLLGKLGRLGGLSEKNDIFWEFFPT